MDVLEKLNRRFGAWYESLFGGASDADLRPRDILRRILASMEDGRREGLDGQIYVPNHYTLDIAVTDEDERDYLRTFLDAAELSAAVRRHARQHNYRMRGGLAFQINEVAAIEDETGRVRVRCRFDATVPPETLNPPEDVDDARHATPPPPHRPLDDYADDEEPGTVPAVALASLTVPGAGGRQDAYPLTTRGAQIGRSRQAGNDIVLADDGMVSKRHARIEYDGGHWRVRDLGSTNGTFVNGAPAGEGRTLENGDEVRVGRTPLVFSTAAGGARRPQPLSAPPAGSALRLVHAGGEAFPLASEMTVGRALTSDILLMEEGVAPRHAAITLRGEQVYVEDLSTPTGTFVNGERIPAQFAVALYEGDSVAFGKATLRLERSGGARQR